MNCTLAIVQPLAHRPPNDERNVAAAVRHIETAAQQGAQVVLFPETYPGPWRVPTLFDPIPQMTEAAARYGVYVVFGTLEPFNDGTRRAYNVLLLARPTGGSPGRYRRTYPPGPWIYRGGTDWDFDYVAADEFPVFDTEYGTIGLAMCSEVYMPEVSRALALRGAEMIFLPAGTDKQQLWASWRCLIWARAIENLAIVATTQNLFGREQRGLAMVAAPEEIIFETTQPGLFLVEIGLDRIRDLRAQDDRVDSQRRNGAKAGVLTQWQRPELRDALWPAGGALVRRPRTGTPSAERA